MRDRAPAAIAGVLVYPLRGYIRWRSFKSSPSCLVFYIYSCPVQLRVCPCCHRRSDLQIALRRTLLPRERELPLSCSAKRALNFSHPRPHCVTQETAQKYEVFQMPTFLFMRKGEVVEQFSGANVEVLRQKINGLGGRGAKLGDDQQMDD